MAQDRSHEAISNKISQLPLAAIFFYELGQKCQFSKTISQQLFLYNYFKIGPTVEFLLIFFKFFQSVAMATKVLNGFNLF